MGLCMVRYNFHYVKITHHDPSRRDKSLLRVSGRRVVYPEPVEGGPSTPVTPPVRHLSAIALATAG